MSLIHIDGFDHYATADLAAKGWTSGGVNASVTLTGGRTGGGGLSFASSSSATAVRGVATAEKNSTFIMGFAYKPNTVGNSGGEIAAMFGDNAATQHITLSATLTGALEVRRGTQVASTVLASSSGGVIPAAAWSYVELLVTLSDTVGVVKVRVNGALVIDASALDTKNAGTATVFDAVRLGHASSASDAGTVDDFYLCNVAGTVNNGFLGDCRVRTLLPNGNGANSGLLGSDANSIDNYLLVDEATPDVADYVGSGTDNLKDTYLFPDLTETVGAVRGVQVNSYAAKTDAGAKSLALVTRSGAADYDSADLALGTSAGYLRQLRELDPATAAAWTIAGVNAAEFGVKVRP